MKNKDVLSQLEKDNLKEILHELYGEDAYVYQKKRYMSLVEKFTSRFGHNDIRIISSPGRTELGGNHTDHNHGKVLAASIQLDSLAVVAPNHSGTVTVWSEGFSGPFSVEIDALEEEPKGERATSSLIRGILSVFKSKGLKIGGFDAFITSDVLIGSGLSSSASIEVLLGKILGVLFNDDSVNAVDLAIVGQKAENDFLHKPCGLMDQVACAYGGIVAIDFADPGRPIIESLHYSFEEEGYKLLVIDTGGDHADLTDDYAAIPKEMKSVAESFGQDVCRGINQEDFFRRIPELSSRLGDRAVLRVLHFLMENDRVDRMVDSLKCNELDGYLDSVKASGDSSFKYLQNVFTSKYDTIQKVSLAIGLTEAFDGFHGAVRVHGGGFAGTVQVYIEKDKFERFRNYMEHFFGTKSVTPLKIRQKGAVCIL
ncbi:galactokinase [Spirochaeta isovalerica]|uniref:Galactokinase n=1 Tax=Spirochaeta isovalerica TaxID=150 RepID=A0A841R5P0_9SPIO|nr:galactokinase family protein [Spirochaeta isovalerica]MBB6479143.1 galactokinase [Spirochaeta isovalerica]